MSTTLVYRSSPDVSNRLVNTRIGPVAFEIAYSHTDRQNRAVFGVFAPSLDKGRGRGMAAPAGCIDAAIRELIDDECADRWSAKHDDALQAVISKLGLALEFELMAMGLIPDKYLKGKTGCETQARVFATGARAASLKFERIMEAK